MKKVLIILSVLFCWVNSYSQNIQRTSNKNTIVIYNGVVGADSATIYNYGFLDTAQANFGWLKNQAGAQIRVNNEIWMRSSCKCQWVKQSAGGITPGTFTGVDSITVDTTYKLICQWIGGNPTCYPILADSVRIVGDTSVCVYISGVGTCLPSSGDNITVIGGIDSVVVSGVNLCWYPHSIAPTPVCVSLNNSGAPASTFFLTGDSLYYVIGDPSGNPLDSASSLFVTVVPEPLSRATIRGNSPLDSIFVGFDETGLPFNNSYLVSTAGVSLVGTTLTITAPIYWVYYGADSSELVNQVFSISTASAGDVRIDVIWIDSLGVFQKTVGTPDTAIAVAPLIDYNGIVVAYANIDGNTITVNGVSSFQGNGVVYTQGIGVNNGQAKTDSLNFGYNETTRNLTLTGTYISNNAGGVALSLIGGSAVRANNGNGILYLDASQNNATSEVQLRTGASYQNRLILKPSGNVLIGTNSTTDIPSAILTLVDSTKGFLVNRVTGALMAAIASPATGLLVYNLDSTAFCYYTGSAWG